MKYLLIVLLGINVLGWSQEKTSQEKISIDANDDTTVFGNTNSRKGQFYFFWGWNHSGYSKSNIHLKGEHYDFTLHNVSATHRPTKFTVKNYFHPKQLTTPQYNVRIGYYLSNKWDVSLGLDHMKYVVTNDQMGSISGSIQNTGTLYDGQYEKDPILLTEDFFRFQHTDGLNYLNVGMRRTEQFFDFNTISIDLITGGAFGIVIPKTDTILMGRPRYDEFHLSGFGINATAGVTLNFFKDRFFIQSLLKGGFVTLPWVRTSTNKIDKAHHHFFFYQYNIVFGGRINFNFKKGK